MDNICTGNFNSDFTNILALPFEVGGIILVLNPDTLQEVNRLEIELPDNKLAEDCLGKL